jgi:hypothetical protein
MVLQRYCVSCLGRFEGLGWLYGQGERAVDRIVIYLAIVHADHDQIG